MYARILPYTSRQCGFLNISQSYRPPRPVTEIPFFNDKIITFKMISHRFLEQNEKRNKIILVLVGFPLQSIKDFRLQNRNYCTYKFCVKRKKLTIYLILVFWFINVKLTFYSLLFFDMFRPHTAIFRCYSYRSWCSVMPFFSIC
jgi:hypothetical protein